jgi:hypothetical protein
MSTSSSIPRGRGARSRAATIRTAGVLCVALGLLSTGCLYTRYASDTRRSATEQLLISRSVDDVVARLPLPDVDGRGVAVDAKAVDTSDTSYLQAALEARLLASGARIMPAADAELLVTAIVGAIGTVSRKASFGLPAIPVPPIGATPEIPIVSVLRQRGWTRARAIVRDRAGAQVAASDDVMAQSHFDITSVVFFELRSNNIYPEEESTVAID